MTPTAIAAPPFTPDQEKTLKSWTAYYPYPIMGLIEAMRAVQEWHHRISPDDEKYLAELFDVPVAHVHGVATFFPLFTQKPAGRRRIGICHGLSCAMAGADKMAHCLSKTLGVKEGETTPDGEFSFEEVECLGACDSAPALILGEDLKGKATEELIAAIASKKEVPTQTGFYLGTPKNVPAVLTARYDNPKLAELETYRGLGGYKALEKALSMKRPDLIAEVKKSNLRGLGGAGFPTGMKWETVPLEDKLPGPRFVVVNADESEPACYKDRVIMTANPHQLLEGILIASYAIGAKDSFIFIRAEYGAQYAILKTALAEAQHAGLVGDNILGKGFSCRIKIMRGAGAYICGLDTALLETMEGKKAWPRQPPPFPTVAGLMGRPTVVNNVETLSMLAPILSGGGEAFAKLGAPKTGGTGVYSVSGHVAKPGIYEFPMGAPLRAIIEAAGGVPGGKKLKAVMPGGASTPPINADEIDMPMDFDSPKQYGTFLGAGGIVVMDETVNMARVAHNTERFLAHESCGQCTPCREGSNWTVRILERMFSGAGVAADLPNLTRMGENITGRVICALGDTVGAIAKAYLKKFPKDFESYLSGTDNNG
ncbi:MAG: NADH-quinone oxidoreductase subunit NuoF [Elusimicrobiota bacterium]